MQPSGFSALLWAREKEHCRGVSVWTEEAAVEQPVFVLNFCSFKRAMQKVTRCQPSRQG